jgi:hypothetical protein
MSLSLNVGESSDPPEDFLVRPLVMLPGEGMRKHPSASRFYIKS